MSTPLARAHDSSDPRPHQTDRGERAAAPGAAARRGNRLTWFVGFGWCTLAAVLVGGRLPQLAAVWVDDVGQCACAVAAGACCAATALRGTGRRRRAWAWFAVAGLGWGAGQLVWSVDELLLSHARPFPSVADAGFLVFPVAAALAITQFPTENARVRGRDVIDGLILALTLGAVSWSTGLGAVVRDGREEALGRALSVAYPVGDVIVLTMALLAFARSTAGRSTLALAAGGAAAMAVSDGVFTYQTALGVYSSGHPASLGWDAAFVLIAMAALGQGDRRAPRLPTPASDGRPATGSLSAVATAAGPQPSPAGRESRLAAVLLFVPYLPLTAAGAVAVVQWLLGMSVDGGEIALLVGAVALALVRQFVTLRDNRRLTVEIEARTADLDRQAERDPLTGLVSRSHFIDHVGRALDAHRRTQTPLAVICCDVNDFKGVNEGLGHAVGDQLLTMVAARLTQALDGEGVLARLGGDEFAVLLTEAGPQQSQQIPGPVGAASARELAARLRSAVAMELAVKDVRVCVGMSVGVAHVAGQDETPSTDGLLSRADIAMYTAKRAPATGPVLYRQGLSLPETGDWILRAPLEQALREGAVLPYYQPIVELEPGRLHGFEALARWRRGMDVVSPEVFLPVAQRAGLMPALTAHMLRAAAAQLVGWTSRPGLGHLRVAVNVSPEQLVDPQFPDVVRAVLDEFDVPVGALVIEITEEVLLSDLEAAIRAAQTLRSLGVLICLDDFGVGYSSLAHLHRLPLDKLKLDQSFVQHVETDASLRRLLGGLFALSRDLGLDVVAEGIERPGQARALRDLGCPMGQGLLYSGPVEPLSCEPILARMENAYGGRMRIPLRVTV
jgi:diguanylate cyclase